MDLFRRGSRSSHFGTGWLHPLFISPGPVAAHHPLTPIMPPSIRQVPRDGRPLKAKWYISKGKKKNAAHFLAKGKKVWWKRTSRCVPGPPGARRTLPVQTPPPLTPPPPPPNLPRGYLSWTGCSLSAPPAFPHTSLKGGCHLPSSDYQSRSLWYFIYLVRGGAGRGGARGGPSTGPGDSLVGYEASRMTPVRPSVWNIPLLVWCNAHFFPRTGFHEAVGLHQCEVCLSKQNIPAEVL